MPIDHPTATPRSSYLAVFLAVAVTATFCCGVKVVAQSTAKTSVYKTTNVPVWGIMELSDGRFYAVDDGSLGNCLAGKGGCGTIHQITNTYDFFYHAFNYTGSEGAYPGNLVEGTHSSDDYPYVWGTTAFAGSGGSPYCNSNSQGCGTFYDGELVSDGGSDFTQVLHSFTWAEGGQGGMITLGSDGNYYGVSVSAIPLTGPDYGFPWSAWVVTPAGEFTKLAVFLKANPNDPANVPATLNGGVPYQLLEGDDGLLYGLSGPSQDTANPRNGAFFSMTKEGTVTLLATFPNDFSSLLGGYPVGQLVEGNDQAFYGVTGEPLPMCESGSSACGTVFRVTKGGDIETLHAFSTTDGYDPVAGLWLGSDGVLYGTTYYGGDTTQCVTADTAGCGTLFSIHTDGSDFQVLHTFEGGADGAHPINLTQDSGYATTGNLYGTAGSDGATGSPGGLIFQTKLPAGHQAAPVQVQVYLASDMSPVPAKGVPINTPLVVEWKVLNAFSNTMQACYAKLLAQNHKVSGYGWSGYQKGTLRNSVYSGQANVSLPIADTFGFTLVCGGIESAGAGVTTYNSLAIQTVTLPNGAVNTNYSTLLSVEGGTAPYTWSITSGSLPAGITLNSASGLISGKPNQFGTSSFRLEVTDSAATPEVTTADLTITVAATLAINTTTLPSAHINQAYRQTISVTGGISPYTYSAAAGSLPAGLALDPMKGVVSGTPTKAGTYTFTISVSDSETTPDTITQVYTLVVAADPLVITTASLPSAGVGNPFSVTLAASGGVTPYLWTQTSGTLPKGLLLSGGTISGTPQQYGPGSSFTLQVSDTETPAQTATVSFTLPVKNTLTITSTTLPTATQGMKYSAQVQSSGGLAPFTWSAGAKLDTLGLAIDPATGIISGTPTVSGPYSGGVSVKDGEDTPATVTTTITIPINPAPPVITTTAIGTSSANAAVGQPVTFTAKVSSSLTATGTVTFASGTATLGTATLNASNVATFNTSFSAAGIYSISASYSGDTYNAASISTPIVETVVAPSVEAALAPSTLTVSSGASGTTTITITPVGGYTGTVTFSCGTLPEYVSCTFAPPSLTIAAGSGPVTDTLTIDTSAAKSAELQLPSRPGDRGSPGVAAGLVFLSGLLAPWTLLACRKKHRALIKQLLPCLLLFVALGGLAVLSGCGGTSHKDTPPGTYAVPITVKLGNGSSVSASVSIAVQ